MTSQLKIGLKGQHSCREKSVKFLDCAVQVHLSDRDSLMACIQQDASVALPCIALQRTRDPGIMHLVRRSRLAALNLLQQARHYQSLKGVYGHKHQEPKEFSCEGCQGQKEWIYRIYSYFKLQDTKNCLCEGCHGVYEWVYRLATETRNTYVRVVGYIKMFTVFLFFYRDQKIKN